MEKSSWLAGFLCIVLVLSGCKQLNLEGTSFVYLEPQSPPESVPSDVINMHFLGTAGVYIQGRGINFLADPFFSNPRFYSALSPFATNSNVERIQTELDRLFKQGSYALNDIGPIIVSHSHYDHAMDIPYIASELNVGCVYGSGDLHRLLPANISYKFCGMAGKVNKHSDPDVKWINASPRIRFAPIIAQHFSHFAGVMYASGHAYGPAKSLSDWKLGDTYSYVIDILSDDDAKGPVFRIFYMPSAATYPVGAPPAAVLNDKKKIDLAIIGAAQLEKDTTYPGSLLATIDPKYVMLVHWENFFDGYKSRPRTNFRVDPKEIEKRIKAVPKISPEVYWPERRSTLHCVFTSNTAGSFCSK